MLPLCSWLLTCCPAALGYETCWR